MSARFRILQVEDSPTDAELVLRELRAEGLQFEVERVHDERAYLHALALPPHLVLSDYALPQFDGLTALSLLKERHPDVPFILISGAIGEDLAVEAMRKGAWDYLLKDRLTRLPTAVRGALEQGELRRQNRLLEERLARAARLESLGRLSAGIAHDLNNILLPIMMAVELLGDEFNTGTARDLLETIETSATRGAHVLKQLLMFGRGTNNQRIPLQVARAIDEVCQVMRETFPKAVSVHTEVTDSELVVLADPTHLQQILLNLCDAMRGGGSLTLRIEAQDVDETLARGNPGSVPGPHVVLSVRDSGTGIDPKDLEQIFDPFFTTKEIEHGTGLGLSSVLGIVQSYGGIVQVSSTLGWGTEFKVWLRQHLGEAVPERVSSSLRANSLRQPVGKAPLVVLVDDEPAVLDVLGASVGRLGYRVMLINDGERALEQLAGRLDEVGVLVTDLAMPGLDGLRLVEALKRLRSDLPVVVMTAVLPREQRQELAALGVSEYLIKPFQAAALLGGIERALQHRALEQQSGVRA
jgi:signal transduction histidine kinase